MSPLLGGVIGGVSEITGPTTAGAVGADGVVFVGANSPGKFCRSKMCVVSTSSYMMGTSTKSLLLLKVTALTYSLGSFLGFSMLLGKVPC